MINANIYSSSNHSPKVGIPTSPPAKRKDIEYALHFSTSIADYLRRDTNIAISPSHHYPKANPEQTCIPVGCARIR